MVSHDSPPPKSTAASFVTPLLISMIGILSASIALVVYHFLVVKLCLRGRQRTADSEAARPPAPQVPCVTTGVDQKLLEIIPIIAYSANEEGDHHLFRKDQSECVVCLGELEDGEMVRLLPNCKHSFHVPCIDEWFVAHISCPICRSPIVSEDPPALEHHAPTSPPPPPPLPGSCLDGRVGGVVFPSENRNAPGRGTVITGKDDASSSGVNTQPFATLLSCGSLVLPAERTSSSARGIAGLRRSWSLDQSSVIINIQQQRESGTERDCLPSSSNSSSSSSSMTKDDLLDSRTNGPLSMKHLDCVSSKLRMSLSRLRGKNSDSLPF